MRPERLVLRGFTSFAEEQVLDLGDVELFALSGPTGHGKTSVIDAMCFALYGTAPRLADRRKVAPLVHEQRNEAAVDLTFAVGEARYRAVRVVRRDAKGGASTREARLERLDDDGTSIESLASGTRDVDAAVESLLGLDYESFTTCVVLPQGEFARFLHARGAERQDLLAGLLGWSLFKAMGRAARERGRELEIRAEADTERLTALRSAATPEVLDGLRSTRDRLAGLLEGLDAVEPERRRLAAEADEHLRRATEADAAATSLSDIAVPDGVEALAERVRRAADAEAAATVADQHAREALEARRAEREALGDVGPVQARLAQHAERQQVSERLDKGAEVVAEHRERLGQADAALAAAEAAAFAAAEELAAARRADAAAAAVAGLAEGDPCPVCGTTLDHLPHDGTGALGEATRRHDEALAAARQAVADRDEARSAVERDEARIEELAARRDELSAALGGAEPADDRATLDRVEAADAAVADAVSAEREARAGLERARAERQRLADDERAAWAAYDDVRDGLEVTGAPRPDRDDLAGSWRSLVAWAAEEAPRRRDEAIRAREAAATAQAAHAELGADVARELDELGALHPGDEVRDACVAALESARHNVAEAEAALVEVEALAERVGTMVEQRQVAQALAKHLKADAFERWLLDEAYARLCEGANRTLDELSAGAYHLTITGERDFAVVDRINADAVRGVRTLSGGETFLVSLALALALAEEIGSLSTGTEVRLESVFLDEGFGTLDPATLDVVATAVEELSAGRRMVGVITHVRDLTDRMPVRFEITKGPSGSTVERVEAGS